MSNIAVQVVLRTPEGGAIPLASCRNERLVKLVSLGILCLLGDARYQDPALTQLAQQERDHLVDVLYSLGVRIYDLPGGKDVID